MIGDASLQRSGFVFRVALTFAWLLCFPSASGLDPKDYAVDVTCEVQLSPAALQLAWPQSNLARLYYLRKRPNPSMPWGEPVVLPGEATGYLDREVTTGTPVEYEVQMELITPGYEGETINAYSYVYGGINIPPAERRGRVLVLVDSTVAPGIGPALNLFLQDLVGAGWTPTLREVSRDATPPQVKEMIRAEFNSGGGLRTVVLVGHVPVPYSGNIAPDFHESHRGAWPADAFYGDMVGEWSDQSVSVRSVDSEANDNLPGDGKFDPSQLPAPIVLEIGRIDFWDMPSFAPQTEVDLLNRYFRKNHEFRQRLFTAPRRAVVHDGFRDVDGDAPAVDAWRHFPLFLGGGNVREIGPDMFLPALSNEPHLWTYGAGGGSFTKADGVGTTAQFASADPQAVFVILHGSYFGDWNTQDNLLRAAIATPRSSLASIWSGLPHWYLHHMGLGETVGYSARITQNNRGEYKSYRNFSTGEVHISLMGDPTLEMFPVMPPRNLSATVNGAIQLRWESSSDEAIVGYHVYHSNQQLGPFNRLTAAPVTAASFDHLAANGTHFYMVRALKLERTGSGTYYNLSQGIFVSAVKTDGPPANRPPTISEIPSQTIFAGESTPEIPFYIADPDIRPSRLTLRVSSSNRELLPEDSIFLRGADSNRGVQATPVVGFAGTATIRIEVTDGELSSYSEFSLTVLPRDAAPALRAIRIERGNVVLTLSGPPQQTLQVVSSADSDQWRVAGNVVIESDGVAEFGEPFESGPLKLYRAVWTNPPAQILP